jgi:hypothetical protein
MGRVVACEVVDHIIPHDGDHALIFDAGNLQSSCTWHHSVVKQILEAMWRAGKATVTDLKLDSPLALSVAQEQQTNR